MKTLFLMLGLMFGGGLFAQTDSVIPNNSNQLLKQQDMQEKRDPLYCCRKCNYTSSKPGACPVDKSDLIKEGAYYCPVHGALNSSAGKCPKCGKKLKKMETPTKEG